MSSGVSLYVYRSILTGSRFDYFVFITQKTGVFITI
jgi:hypothetical protein